MTCSKGLGSLVCGGLLAQVALCQTVTFRFTPLPPRQPGATHVLVAAINERGNLVGSYAVSPVWHGFYLESASSGVYSTLDFPGASYTMATGINDKSEIAGYYGSSWSGAVSPGDHGFISRDGQFTTVDYPNSAGTRLYAIDNAGDAVGESTSVGFIYSDGKFHSVTCPDGRTGHPFGINNKGQVVGICSHQAGFLLSADVVSLIDFRAPWLSTTGIVPGSINDDGDIVGWYYVENARHGFLLTAGPNPEFITVDEEPQGLVQGINNKRQIVGYGSSGSFSGQTESRTPSGR